MVPRLTPAERAASALEKPAEESRLSAAVFRAGLKKRGLTELLELHVRDYPPADETEAAIMLREVKLAESADPTLSEAERNTALAEANRILEGLIQREDQDPRRFLWMFDLAHSLLYQQAEPYLTRILYRGGGAGDHQRLLALSTRAVKVLTRLVGGLTAEYERLDRMAIGQFEALEAEGYLEQLDGLAPRAEYLLLWALFYDSLPREDSDPLRATQLNKVLERISENPTILNAPHETSHVQVQALLLTGMTYRLLNDHQRAREHLDRALSVAEGTEEPAERQRIEWAITLAWLERVRNEADDGRFEDALERIAQFRSMISTTQRADGFGLRIVAALLERSVYRLRSDLAEQSGYTSQATQYRQRAWQAVARLARVEPDRRDEIYAALYDAIGRDDPAGLDPLERCAVIAGLLSDASRSSDEPKSLDRAIEVGERFLAERPAGAETLVPEVLYNMAVAEYRRNRPAAAVRRFLEVAREYAHFDMAQQSATFAVQLAAELYSDPTLGEHPGVRDLYGDALALLIDRYPQTDAGRYWRFHYAQLLEESGDFARAAMEYALVDEQHEHHVEALFHRARCVATTLKRESAGRSQDSPAHQRSANDFFTVQREFVARATSELNAGPEPDRTASLRSLLARARLLAAEVQVLPLTSRPAQALETLREFEDRHPDEKALAGRVWRVRLLAYEELGRLDEATEAIPAYITADPQNAGPTLQSLYADLTEDVDRLQSSGASNLAQRKAEMALVLARQIHEWAMRTAPSSTDSEPHIWTVQLAEANLRANRHARARELFASLMPTTGKPATGEPENDVRLLFGYAEALYHLGEFGEALPKFNRLATGLPASDPVRWKALLRDLQCRAALDHPASGVIKVIRQQQQLYPDLGGPSVKPQLERLLRESERRIDEGP